MKSDRLSQVVAEGDQGRGSRQESESLESIEGDWVVPLIQLLAEEKEVEEESSGRQDARDEEEDASADRRLPHQQVQ